MKKIIFISAFFGFSLASNAQVTFTPEVGYNLMKFDGYQYDPVANERHKINYDWRFTPRAGIAIDFPFGNSGFSIETGLYFTMRESQFSQENDTMRSKVINTFKYVELPLSLKYSWTISENSGKLFVQATSFSSYGIGGESLSEITTLVPVIKKFKTPSKIDYKDENNIYNQFETGVYFGIGYQFPWGMQVRGMYGRSLSNISKIENNYYSSGNMFNLSIGYVLNRRIPGRFY
ncbi:MAG TPA: outer membrane beta-barrel protein [Edaphocola sp.]|nr:outer membrane beta-barrel protein [Edaphocola sp.]